MNDKTDPDLQALAAEVKHLREDFARVGTVVEDLVRHRASAAAGEASRRANEAWDEINRTAENAAHTIEQNPLSTIGGAFGLGLVLGMLFSGRR